MTKTGISLNWGGLKESVNRATAVIADAQGLMTNIGMAMKGQTTRRFQAGEGPDGAAWKPLAGPRKPRAGEKKKKPGRVQVLVNTGHLRDTISFSATPSEVHVGSNKLYARIHQLGGKAGRGRKVTIPARPYLGLSEDDQAEIAALVAEHLAECFK